MSSNFYLETTTTHTTLQAFDLVVTEISARNEISIRSLLKIRFRNDVSGRLGIQPLFGDEPTFSPPPRKTISLLFCNVLVDVPVVPAACPYLYMPLPSRGQSTVCAWREFELTNKSTERNAFLEVSNSRRRRTWLTHVRTAVWSNIIQVFYDKKWSCDVLKMAGLPLRFEGGTTPTGNRLNGLESSSNYAQDAMTTSP